MVLMLDVGLEACQDKGREHTSVQDQAGARPRVSLMS